MNSSVARRSILAFRQICLTAPRALSSGHHAPKPPAAYSHFSCDQTMNEYYPLPDRTYEETFKKTNAKYNKCIALAGLMLISSIIYTYSSGTYDILAPPPRKVNTDDW